MRTAPWPPEEWGPFFARLTATWPTETSPRSTRFTVVFLASGPAFFTKLLWALGETLDVWPKPLILDSRVWASLEALRWDSRLAAGSRRWSKRYIAYLRACEAWAGERFVAQDVEFTVFDRAPLG